jgi:hypothetical protein
MLRSMATELTGFVSRTDGEKHSHSRETPPYIPMARANGFDRELVPRPGDVVGSVSESGPRISTQQGLSV